ncbi:MAG: hypothetical protein AB1546_09770, partial [bacterium]
DNMRRQHTEKIRDFLSEKPQGVSVVAIAAGEGMKRLFLNLGAAGIVEGGQSMNPSMEEILRAVEMAPGAHIILLPNNPNIFLTAAKVREISTKEIHLVPAETMAHGIAAMVDFDPARQAAETLKQMQQAASSISVAEITRAVRNSATDGMNIKKGDIIAIVGDELVAAADSLYQVMENITGRFKEQGAELITLYHGEEIDFIEAEKITEHLRGKFPDTEFELHNGGQPHYLFLVSGE